eukprot:4243927-Pyramimonas_sp.AAC.1
MHHIVAAMHALADRVAKVLAAPIAPHTIVTAARHAAHHAPAAAHAVRAAMLAQHSFIANAGTPVIAAH